MADFKIINTQEELNSIIQERLNKEKQKISTIEKEKEDLQKQFDEINQKYNTSEEAMEKLRKEVETHKMNELKRNIAKQNGLADELSSRLMGNTEEELEADAKRLSTKHGLNGVVISTNLSPRRGSFSPIKGLLLTREMKSSRQTISPSEKLVLIAPQALVINNSLAPKNFTT